MLRLHVGLDPRPALFSQRTLVEDLLDFQRERVRRLDLERLLVWVLVLRARAQHLLLVEALAAVASRSSDLDALALLARLVDIPVFLHGDAFAPKCLRHGRLSGGGVRHKSADHKSNTALERLILNGHRGSPRFQNPAGRAAGPQTSASTKTRARGFACVL